MPSPSGIAGPIPPGQDPDDYDRRRRRVLWSMPTGLFVVGSRSGDSANLMTANLVMQVSTSPKLVAVAVETGSVTAGLIRQGARFSISILARADRSVVRRFVKPVEDLELGPDRTITEMQGEAVIEVAGGVPVLASAAGWLACQLRQTVELEAAPGESGSHLLFIGEVVDVGETAGGGDQDEPGPGEVLRMEDTRMNYGG
ncbi:MAG TPA: flavin reductase family protein [Acidimicrobiales bacterium]|jgi:flavin reductase (DIM6/NTAB) family NADH-FMN oxidoreductase RutF|nr:flavin reductase family protein [Acidimicrobiales bacterium]